MSPDATSARHVVEHIHLPCKKKKNYPRHQIMSTNDLSIQFLKHNKTLARRWEREKTEPTENGNKPTVDPDTRLIRHEPWNYCGC